MADLLTTVLLACAALGVSCVAVQIGSAVRHVRRPAPAPKSAPFISILKPLCGVDDGLAENLESFVRLSYPNYEVVLGVEDSRDPAFAIACRLAARFPERVRVAVQRGAPGLNPKVNQLITLAARARHEVLLVSDSNVAVEPSYLHEIAAHLEDASVGVVTHPIAGRGEQTWGSLFDNVHLSVAIAPGMIATNGLLGMPLVVGKSMAFRRADLDAIGGFAALKDVLAEDYVMGKLVAERLGKRVAVAHRPITNVSRARTLRSFCDRYARWSVLQRMSVGNAMYAGVLLLNPLPFALLAFAIEPDRRALAALLATALAKAALEACAARALRPGGVSWVAAASMPIKDALLFWAWLVGFAQNEVRWRGRRLAVLEGTRLVPIGSGAAGALGPRGAATAGSRAS
jgi:ceramide glucosyltransferase